MEQDPVAVPYRTGTSQRRKASQSRLGGAGSGTLEGTTVQLNYFHVHFLLISLDILLLSLYLLSS